MSKKVKLGKISVVVFLTALIWVWADLAQNERLEMSGLVTITVARSGDPNLWVALEKEGSALRSTLVLDQVVLKGAARRIAEVERKKNKGELDLDLFLVPESMGLTETAVRSLDTLSVLRQSAEIRQLSLTVESCEPKTFTAQVRRLRMADVAVECVDERGDSVLTERLEPARVNVAVPPDGIFVARIRLTAEERRRAQEAPLEKIPYVELPDGRRKDATDAVTVKLPPVEDPLKTHNISPTLGFCMSQNLQGKYAVRLHDDPTRSPLIIRATPLAYEAYNLAPFHMVLYIKDSDRQAMGPITRQVVFSFPEEYVRRNEIKADLAPPDVVFDLVPLPEEKADASGP